MSPSGPVQTTYSWWTKWPSGKGNRLLNTVIQILTDAVKITLSEGTAWANTSFFSHSESHSLLSERYLDVQAEKKSQRKYSIRKQMALGHLCGSVK